MLPHPVSLHDVDDIEAHCRATIKRALGRNGGYLREQEHTELLDFLLETAMRLADRYDPRKGKLSFSSFCGQICQRRTVDWYRKEFGDSRYGTTRPRLVSLDATAATTGRSIAEVIGTTFDGHLEEVLTRVSFAG